MSTPLLDAPAPPPDTTAGGGAATGYLHSWDLSTGVDGPGTRFVAFLAGCPLRCRYCQNPDTWRRRDGRRVSVDSVVAELTRYRRFISVAGGGFTVSGGEPLAQPGFAAALLRGARELGMHTALDTSGFFRSAGGPLAGSRSAAGGATAADPAPHPMPEPAPHPALEPVLEATDLALLDIKSWLPETYRALTGVSIRPTLAFARPLAERSIPTWIRFVLVPGVTDAPANIEGLAEFVAGLGNVERVDVLPFHRLGAAKYDTIGIRFPLAGVAPPDADALARAREPFRVRGLAVT